MTSSCIENVRFDRTCEGGDETIYFTLELSARKCSMCNWKDGWNTKITTGFHPCEIVTKFNPYLYEMSVSQGYNNEDDVWRFVYRFKKSEMQGGWKNSMAPALVRDKSGSFVDADFILLGEDT